jgi:hypothetical protein
MSGVSTYFPITHNLEEVSDGFGFSRNFEARCILPSFDFVSNIQ